MANKVFILIFSLLFSLPSLADYPLAPDPVRTPGELCSEEDPDFDHYRYEENIPYCVRRLSSYRKQQIYELYDIPQKCRSQYTIDHFIPLSLGGNNSDANLWPEHILVKSARHRLEMDLFWAIRRGEINQEEAIFIVTTEKRGFKVNPVDSSAPNDKCGLPDNLM